MVAREICKRTITAPPEIILPFRSSPHQFPTQDPTALRTTREYPAPVRFLQKFIMEFAPSISACILGRIIGVRDKNVGCCYKEVEVAWNRCPERIKRPKIYRMEYRVSTIDVSLGFSMKTILLIF